MYGFDLILQSATTLIKKKVSCMHKRTQNFMTGKDHSIKTSGSESRCQKEATCTDVFRPNATTTVSYLHR